jgi:hypothetical protein
MICRIGIITLSKPEEEVDPTFPMFTTNNSHLQRLSGASLNIFGWDNGLMWTKEEKILVLYFSVEPQLHWSLEREEL